MKRKSKKSPARARKPLPAGEPAESIVVVRGVKDEVVVEYRPDLPAIRVAIRPRTDSGRVAPGGAVDGRLEDVAFAAGERWQGGDGNDEVWTLPLMVRFGPPRVPGVKGKRGST